MSGPACDRCRIKHISCDRKRPCQHCTKGRTAESCHYTPKRRARTASLSNDCLAKGAAGELEAAGADALDYDLRHRRRGSSPHTQLPEDPFGSHHALPLSVAMGVSESTLNMYSLKNLRNGEEVFGSVAPIQLASNVPNAHLYPPMMLFLPSIAGHQAMLPMYHRPIHPSLDHPGQEPLTSFPLDIIKHFEIYGAGANDK